MILRNILFVAAFCHIFPGPVAPIRIIAFEFGVFLSFFLFTYIDGVAEWFRRSVSNLLRSTRVGSNLVVGTTNRKPTSNSAVHPFEVDK